MIARLVECTDHDVEYGILIVENAGIYDVQDKINDIKNKFFNEGKDWTISDMLMEFPEEWEWDYKRHVNVIEI